MRREQVRKPKVDGVHLHALSHFVQPNFNGASRVDRPVASHGPRSRFVGPNASARVVEGAELVGCGGQHAVVIRRHVAEGSKTSPVDEGVDIETRNSAFIVGGHLHVDVAGVPASVDPVHLFPVEGDANRLPGFTSQDGSAHLVRKRVGFAAEATADKGANHVDLVHGDVEDGGERPVGVMGNLLRRVQLQAPVRPPMSDNSVRLGKAVVHARHRP